MEIFFDSEWFENCFWTIKNLVSSTLYDIVSWGPKDQKCGKLFLTLPLETELVCKKMIQKSKFFLTLEAMR